MPADIFAVSTPSLCRCVAHMNPHVCPVEMSLAIRDSHPAISEASSLVLCSLAWCCLRFAQDCILLGGGKTSPVRLYGQTYSGPLSFSQNSTPTIHCNVQENSRPTRHHPRLQGL